MAKELKYHKATIKIIEDIRITEYCGCGDIHESACDLMEGQIFDNIDLSVKTVPHTNCYHWITEDFRYALIPERCFIILPEK